MQANNLTANSSTTRFAGPLLDKYVAPKLSELTTCNVPVIEEPPNYLGSFVLNSIFTMTYPDPLGRIILIFGRRVIYASKYSCMTLPTASLSAVGSIV